MDSVAEFYSKKCTLTHPCWGFRCNLIKKHPSFNKNAIMEIAELVNYDNMEYINKLTDEAKIDFKLN